MDRSGAKNALSAVASVAGAATMYYSAADVIFGIVWGVSLAIFHSLFRPIDLKSTLNNLWEDAKGVQSREEAAALARKGVKGLQSWWKNRRPNEPTPVVMNVKEIRTRRTTRLDSRVRPRRMRAGGGATTRRGGGRRRRGHRGMDQARLARRTPGRWPMKRERGGEPRPRESLRGESRGWARS